MKKKFQPKKAVKHLKNAKWYWHRHSSGSRKFIKKKMARKLRHVNIEEIPIEKKCLLWELY